MKRARGSQKSEQGMRILCFILVILIASLVVHLNSSPVSTGVREAYKAVYRILNFEETGGGTGWRLSDGHIITNAHVCDGVAKDGRVMARDYRGQAQILTVEEVNEDYDLCRLSRTTSPYYLPIASEGAAHFQAIYSVGHPLLEDSRFEPGIYIADVPVKLGGRAQADGKCPAGTELVETPFFTYCIRTMILSTSNVRTFPGNSGSPVVNESGEVVGVINSANSTTSQGSFIPYRDVITFLGGRR